MGFSSGEQYFVTMQTSLDWEVVGVHFDCISSFLFCSQILVSYY